MARKYSQLSASEADAYVQRAKPDVVNRILKGEDVDVDDEETPPATAAPKPEEPKKKPGVNYGAPGVRGRFQALREIQ